MINDVALSNESYELPEPEPQSSTGRTWQVTAVSLLQRTEIPNWWPDLLLVDIYFLLWGGFGTLGEDSQGLSTPQTTADPCCFFMCAPMIVPEKTWSISSMTTWLWRRQSRTWQSTWCLLNPDGEGEGLEKEWAYPMGQQLVVQLVSAAGFWFLWLWDTCWELRTVRKRPTQLSGGKASLPTDWPNWWGQL